MATGSNASRVVWKVGENTPSNDLDINAEDVVPSCLLPRPLAWLSVDDESICLLEGYTAASYVPPTVFFAASALPPSVVAKLRETSCCSLSVVTERDPQEALKTASKTTSTPQVHTFAELGLESSKVKSDYPVAVQHSPIQMFCSLEHYVPLPSDATESEGDAMIVLIVEIFVIDGSILSPPTESMKTRAEVVAKIDAELIKPVVSLGNGRFSPMLELRSMPRPKKQQQEDTGDAPAGGGWTSTELNPVSSPQTTTPASSAPTYETTEWRFREHGRACPLGYNPVTALIMPRPIGWISTYSKDKRIPHLAPYSFFIDVARGSNPVVAFSGFRRSEGTSPKDAQKDAEETGCFVYNVVTQDLAVPMNYSAAELDRDGNEFELANLAHAPAQTVDAPVVEASPIHFECTLMKSVEVGDFSIVCGKVRAVSIDKTVISNGSVDPTKVKPLTRLGYMDEYGIVA